MFATVYCVFIWGTVLHMTRLPADFCCSVSTKDLHFDLNKQVQENPILQILSVYNLGRR